MREESVDSEEVVGARSKQFYPAGERAGLRGDCDSQTQGGFRTTLSMALLNHHFKNILDTKLSTTSPAGPNYRFYVIGGAPLPPCFALTLPPVSAYVEVVPPRRSLHLAP